MHKKVFFVLFLLFQVASLIAQPESKFADLVIKNAKIITMDEHIQEAQALAVKGDRFLAVGHNQDIEPFIGRQTKVIDAEGNITIPGLIDSHAHFLSLGSSLIKLDLTKVKSWDEVIAMVKKAALNAEPGEWITGRGWHQEKWEFLPECTVEGFPVHTELSKVSQDNPVILSHASGHALFANQKAMSVSGVHKDIPDPDGGKLVRFPDGSPSGVFLENAELLITNVYNTLRSKRPKQQIYDERFLKFSKAAEHSLSLGITSFYDAGSTFEEVDFFKRLADAGKIPLRLWLMLYEENEMLKSKIADYRLIDYGNYHLTVRAIKRYMDGALGARGAWLIEPYTDQPSTCGLNTIPIDEFKESAEIATEYGFQLCTHAIGDRANREVLDVYQDFILNNPQTDLRWRIEHAQHLNPTEIPRFAKLGVIAAMQGIHCTSDGPWVPKRIGEERAEQGAYVWRKLMENGALICSGTDAPVEALDPYANIHALVTRQMNNGDLFYPEQKMARMEALKSYTIDAAYSGFEENTKGSISVGKLADFVILSDDILTVPAEQIPNIKVLSTYVGGKNVYTAK